MAAPWGGHFRFVGDEFSKANACAPVTPEAGPGDPLLWKRLNNLEKFLETEFYHRGIDWTARMGLVRESVAELIAANDTLLAERDSRFALTVIERSEAALRYTCNRGLLKQCRAQTVKDCNKNKFTVYINLYEKITCCRDHGLAGPDYLFFGETGGTRLIASKACEDEATWEAEGEFWQRNKGRSAMPSQSNILLKL